MSINKNFQIIPSKIRVIPNDRVSKKLFNLTTADIQDWIEFNKTYNFIENLAKLVALSNFPLRVKNFPSPNL